MASREEEFKDIFYAEALENYEELNRLFTLLEKDHNDRSSIEAIFRITHTLKANAAAMGFDAIAELAHLLEDIFSAIKTGKASITPTLFNELFRANDKLGELITAIRSEESVRYKGMMTKLKVILRKLDEGKSGNDGGENKPSSPPSADKEPELALVEEEASAEEEAFANGEVANLLKEAKISFSDVVSVPVKKLDQLLNLVGELAIEKDRIMANSARKSINEHAGLHRITSDLQYSVMGVRLVQVSVLFHKFHRIVRDVAILEGKEVNLILEGTEIEIDRNVLQTISDSMIHLVRNAVSHGIEPTEVRKAVKKSAQGTLRLRARNEKDHVVIDIIDDGKGIDPKIIGRKAVEKGIISQDQAQKFTEDEIIKLIFEPGFSSVENITEVSGRGVGMDVVKKSIDSIGGKINIQTEVGKGTTFSLSLPSSMAVKSVLLFELNKSEFAIPLSYTESVFSLYKKDIHKVGNGLMATHLDNTISVIFLNDIFGRNKVQDLRGHNSLHWSYEKLTGSEKLSVIVVSADNKLVGFVVDKLMQQKEIIEKPLRPPVESAHFISGATIMGNGNVCLVLDVPSIVDFLFRSVNPA